MVAEVINAGAQKGVAIGVSGDYFERAQTLVENGVSVLVLTWLTTLCSDERCIGVLKNPSTILSIMAGNVATLEGLMTRSGALTLFVVILVGFYMLH